MKKLLKIDSFVLRIIAMLAMTVDHIGVLFDIKKVLILRIIGRIALPLFVFLTVQGALKTHNKKNYFFRMLILFLITTIALIILPLISPTLKDLAYTTGNIFFDLLFVIFTVWILESENKKIKPLVALPFAYSILSYLVVKIEGCACNGLFTWFPPFLRMQYGIYSLLLGVGFYYSKKIAEKYYSSEIDDGKQQFVSNLLSVATIILVSVLFVGVNYIFGSKYSNILDGIQTYSILSGAFILFYNGTRGYNSKWFNIFSYAYYHVHILIIGLICFL